MKSPDNPYAPPQSRTDAPQDDAAGLAGHRGLVRMTRDGRLPDRCIRCDAPAQGYRVNRRLYWRPAWWRVAGWVALPLLFVVSGAAPVLVVAFWVALLGFAVVDAVFLRRKVEVEIGLCRRHRRLRSGVVGAFVASWVLLIGWLVSSVWGFRPVEHAAFWAIVCAMLVLGIWAGLLYRLGVARMTEEHIWLRGAGRPFRESLPAAGE